MKTFGSIDGVVNNAGIFVSKPFTEYTAQDFEKLSGTKLQRYINMTQLAVKQMLTQNSGGSVTCVSSAMVEHLIAGITASLSMVTKGGLEAPLLFRCAKTVSELHLFAQLFKSARPHQMFLDLRRVSSPQLSSLR